jgi:cytochrome c biogenesis protein
VLETSPQIGLQGVFLPTAASSGGEPVSVFPDQLNPRWMFTVWQGDLGLDSGRPQSVYQLDTTGMTQVRDGTGRPLTVVLAPGESATLPDGLGSVTFERVDRFAALQVRTDPAKGWALAFAVLAIAGLALSLFVARRRVWVRVLPDGGVEVAALARSDDPRLDRELADIVSALPVAVPEAVAQSEPQAEPTRVSAVTD